MHVGINCIYLVPGSTGGTETVARELLPALCAGAPRVRFTAFVGRDAAAADLGVETVVLPVRAARRAEWVIGEQTLLPAVAARLRCDVVHSLGGTAPITGPFARVMTVHDAHYRTLAQAHTPLRRLAMQTLVPTAARRAHRIVTATEASRRDIVEYLGLPAQRVEVIPWGCGRVAVAAPMRVVDVRRQLDAGARPLVLCLSAKRPAKNLVRLLEAWERLPLVGRPVLVLAGEHTAHEQDLRRRASELGITDDVRFTSWLDPSAVEALFRTATALVHPSLGEGFGLPIVEAMQRGVPVACSDLPVLREVAGDTVAYFDPEDVPAMAATLADVFAGGGRTPRVERARRRAAALSWDETARRVLAVYERALAARAAMARR